jgi:hypothetical protein
MAEIQVLMVEGASVVIKESDFDALLAKAQTTERICQELSLAEEGLANYEEEARDLRDLSLTWALACHCNCEMCQVLFERIRDAVPQTPDHSEKT